MVSRGARIVMTAAFAGGVLLQQRVAHADPERDPAARLELRNLPRRTRHGEVIDRAVPFLGGVRLDDPALYRLVGREDLARPYELRWRVGAVLGLSGMAAFIAAIVVAFTAPSHRECTRGRCGDYIYGPRAGIALSLAASVPLFGGAAWLVSPTPLSPEEKASMADGYNAANTPRPAAAQDAGVRAAPVVVPGGAGLGVRGTF